jgi:predicted O-methyltransferase YrrM
MSLIDNGLEVYLRDMLTDCEGEVGQLQRDCYEEGLPIIPKEVVKLLEFQLSVLRPKKILEIGMCVGFSAILMSQYLAEGGSIKTIDRYPIMIERAKENFAKFGVEDKVEMLIGHATEVVKDLDEKFDFIFMDFAKGQYIQILPDVLRLLNTGGVIMVDDILQDGTVALDRLAVPRRQRTIHTRLNDFLYEISHNDKLRTSILTIGDGVALIQKIKD